MIQLTDFINDFSIWFPRMQQLLPWNIPAILPTAVLEKIDECDSQYAIKKGIAIHATAIVEEGVVIKPPAFIGEQCFIGAHAYLRGGVFLCKQVSIGTGCEIKSSIIF